MDEPERIARALLEAFDAQDEGTVASLVSPGVVVQAGDGARHGIEELLVWFRTAWQSLPDRQIDRTWLVDGRLVGWHWHLRGRHVSGQNVDVRGIGWALVEDGRVRELGQVADRLGYLVDAGNSAATA